MPDDAEQISNPFSTGGGGVNFELQVQASFVALMLTGGFAPGLPCKPIQKIKLQGRYDGFNTDDIIVFTSNPDGSEQCKLLGQVKHSIRITAGDTVFGEVIKAAWKDFCNPVLFTKRTDAIALITGPLSATDIEDVRRILEWARSSESAQDFFTKVEKTNFSSEPKRAKLKAFRTHLNTANGSMVEEEDVFLFLRHFHLLGYDLDIRSGVMHAILHSLLGQYSQGQASSLWSQIVQEVMSANQNAGTITSASLPEPLRSAFTKHAVRTMPEELSRTVAPREAHAWNSSEYAPALVLANLLGSWNEKSAADLAIITSLTRGQVDAWLSKIREVIQLPDSPITQLNGIWSVKNRGHLWLSLGSRVFDDHLDVLRECAVKVLTERDPQFDLEPEQRFAAAVYGKVLSHSPHLRKGIAETLALLGSRSAPLVNCSRGKPDLTAVLAVRGILSGADWVRWGSVSDVLPLLAEAAPEELLTAVENELRLKPCVFDNLFAQEQGGISGRNYLTGLLWALETIAWDERFLVRATLSLGALDERDPGGQWGNRPRNSLTTIFLPWLPQTTAPLEKRKVAIQTLLRESPESAWRLLLTLLPTESGASGGSRKPKWRESIPSDWKDHPTDEEYWLAIPIYAGLAADVALAEAPKLVQLIEHLDQLPRPVFERILQHISSGGLAQSAERIRYDIWRSLTRLARKHRRFAEEEWALPNDAVANIESSAAVIAPTNPQYLYLDLFSGRIWDLYDEVENWQEQERLIEVRRQEAMRELLKSGDIDTVIHFAETVEAPGQVGWTLGSLGNPEIDSRILPAMLHAEDEKHKQFAAGFVYGRWSREQWAWVDSINTKPWSQVEIGKLLVCLPFVPETWARVERFLGENAAEYWKHAGVNPYIARGNLDIAVGKLLEHGRSRAAIDCLARIVGDKQPLDRNQATKALILAVSSQEPANELHSGHLMDLIRALQENPATNQDDLLRIEWVYLPLLNRHNGATPKTLEWRLSSDPGTFCEMIRFAFRSDKETTPDTKTSDTSPQVAKNAYRLLQEWRTVPGMAPEGEFSGTAFKEWIEAVKKSCEESGHLDVALLKAGAVLIHCPADPAGLWIHRDVAEVLNRPDMESLRRGYCTSIHNSRGAHFVDPTGKQERELAQKYRRRAEEIENAGYQRVAAVLRSIADGYDREAEQVIASHKAEQQDGTEE